MSTDAEIFDECRRLIAGVAPELLNWPLYLLDSAQTGFIEPTNCLGYATPYTPSELRQTLIRENAWRGDGSVIVFDLPTIRLETALDDFRSHVLRVCLHETAHLLPARNPAPYSGAKPDLIAQVDRERRDEMLEAASSRGWSDADDSHDARFVRRCIHLWFRAVALDFSIPLRDLCAGFQYMQTHPIAYLAVLADECNRLRFETFEKIETSPAPPQFTELSCSDEAFRRKLTGK